MPITNALATIPVHDLKLATVWYGKLLAREPDRAPMPTLAEYDFADGGSLQIFADGARAGQGGVTLTVTDLDAEITRLAGLGIAASERLNGEYADVSTLADPDGNRVVLAQAKASSDGPLELLNKLIRAG